MKTLIVYYSFTGNNKFLLERLRERLQCDTLQIEEQRKRTNFSILLDVIFKRKSKIKKNDVSISRYDHIVLVSPVWAGKVATPMQAFLLRERDNIQHCSFITLCGGVEGQKAKIRSYLESVLPIPPVVVEELWVNDLLPPEKKNNIKYTTPYRVKDEDWKVFYSKINGFLQKINTQFPNRDRTVNVSTFGGAVDTAR